MSDMNHDRPDTGADKLEQAFFVGDGVEVLAEFRRMTSSEQQKAALREVVQIQDDAFLNRLVTLDVRPETAVALRIIPLVFIAWADGEVQDSERAALLRAAGERGIAAEKAARRMLDVWLTTPPDPALLGAWKHYMGKMWPKFSPDEQWQMRQTLLTTAGEIAAAAGSFLGLTSGISAPERAVIDELEELLS
jgi:hypothetical protein